MGRDEAGHRPLILARTTGEEPERTPETEAALQMLASLHEAVRQERLVARYYTRPGSIHGHCFYMGLCDPWTRWSTGSGRRPTTSMTPSA